MAEWSKDHVAVIGIFKLKSWNLSGHVAAIGLFKLKSLNMC
jgi:hypothetical protein